MKLIAKGKVQQLASLWKITQFMIFFLFFEDLRCIMNGFSLFFIKENEIK